EIDPRKAINDLLHADPEPLAYTPDLRWPRGPLPLLARLVRQALIVTNAELHRAAEAYFNGTLPTLDPRLAIPDWDANGLAPPAAYGVGDPAMNALESSGDQLALAIEQGWFQARDCARALLESEPERLDAVLRATLDTASQRVDPWVIGMADRRLRW